MHGLKRTSLRHNALYQHSAAHSDDTSHDPSWRHKSKQMQLANTYKLGPDGDTSFREDEVKKTIEALFEAKIGGMKYDADRCKLLCMELATEIKNEVKLLDFQRYKFIAEVTISSLKGQGLRAVSRCVWDERFDSYVSCTYRNATMCVIAVLYGVYQE
eukprot:Seg3998.2 transcript_id=Seg3998.2/GoldUCD/mRNA.D3Y31 product="Tctex1 domain-containing protein 1-B" protein_id=Seg3998.2/GoldUCD/D3Y31